MAPPKGKRDSPGLPAFSLTGETSRRCLPGQDGERVGLEIGKGAVLKGGADPGHEVVVEVQVVEH